jgi:hypothetical protein
VSLDFCCFQYFFFWKPIFFDFIIIILILTVPPHIDRIEDVMVNSTAPNATVAVKLFTSQFTDEVKTYKWFAEASQLIDGHLFASAPSLLERVFVVARENATILLPDPIVAFTNSSTLQITNAMGIPSTQMSVKALSKEGFEIVGPNFHIFSVGESICLKSFSQLTKSWLTLLNLALARGTHTHTHTHRTGNGR